MSLFQRRAEGRPSLQQLAEGSGKWQSPSQIQTARFPGAWRVAGRASPACMPPSPALGGVSETKCKPSLHLLRPQRRWVSLWPPGTRPRGERRCGSGRLVLPACSQDRLLPISPGAFMALLPGLSFLTWSQGRFSSLASPEEQSNRMYIERPSLRSWLTVIRLASLELTEQGDRLGAQAAFLCHSLGTEFLLLLEPQFLC